MATTSEVRREVQRVFGRATVEPTDVGSDAANYVLVSVDGWPDRATYRVDRLLDTLGKFSDGHGCTEEGDAEICLALEESRAFVCLGG